MEIYDENQMGNSEFHIGFEDFLIKTAISSRYFPLPCLITGGYALKLGNLWKNKKIEGS